MNDLIGYVFKGGDGTIYTVVGPSGVSGYVNVDAHLPSGLERKTLRVESQVRRHRDLSTSP